MSYKPISCSVYDVLEASSVRNVSVRLVIQRSTGVEQRDVKILDLFSKDKTEFLRAKDINTDKEFTLRLGEINRITDLEANKVYSPTMC